MGHVKVTSRCMWGASPQLSHCTDAYTAGYCRLLVECRGTMQAMHPSSIGEYSDHHWASSWKVPQSVLHEVPSLASWLIYHCCGWGATMQALLLSPKPFDPSIPASTASDFGSAVLQRLRPSLMFSCVASRIISYSILIMRKSGKKWGSGREGA